jgi:hypothetical protein
MEKELAAFRKFHTHEAAVELQDLLIRNGIEASVSDAENGFEKLYLGSGTPLLYEVQISPVHFKKAEEILTAAEAEEVEMTDRSYYLYDYSDEALFEIIEKYDEWSSFDFQLAQKILREHGHYISAATIAGMRHKRLDTLAKPERISDISIVLAYVSTALGGILGLFFGYIIMTATKTLPDGNKVYTYTSSDRAHGKVIFYIGLAIVPITLLSIIIKRYY